MKKEDKDLLLKDLCGRLPYNTTVSMAEGGVDGVKWNKVELTLSLLNQIEEEGAWEFVKPHLRPMSSMTEKEKKEFDDFCVIDEDAWMKKGITGFINQSIIMSNGIDWLNMHHFDYHRKYDKKDREWKSMVEMGLALEATEKMYDF